MSKIMRTTISIDDDLLDTSRALAAQHRVSLGKVVSDLVRRGLRTYPRTETGLGGFPVFRVPTDARPITLETVQRAEEEL